MVRVSCRPRSSSTAGPVTGTWARPGEGVEPIEQGGLVVQHREHKVGLLLLAQPPGVFPLRLHRVGRHHMLDQVDGVPQHPTNAPISLLLSAICAGRARGHPRTTTRPADAAPGHGRSSRPAGLAVHRDHLLLAARVRAVEPGSGPAATRRPAHRERPCPPCSGSGGSWSCLAPPGSRRAAPCCTPKAATAPARAPPAAHSAIAVSDFAPCCDRHARQRQESPPAGGGVPGAPLSVPDPADKKPRRPASLAHHRRRQEAPSSGVASTLIGSNWSYPRWGMADWLSIGASWIMCSQTRF